MSVNLAITSTASFLRGIMPWIPAKNVVRGQSNGTPAPLPPSIVITEILQTQYTTTRTKLNPVASTMAYNMPRRLDLQLDCYGPRASEKANVAVTKLRSIAIEGAFPDGVEPLYCGEPVQIPLITGEKQYETRWSVTVSLQYNEPVTVSQESFDVVGETFVIPADITTPTE